MVMPRRFSTYPRVRTEAAMHVHRKSVGRAPFSTTVLVVGNGRSAGTGGYVENLPACAEFGRGKMGAGDRQRENAVREGRRCGSWRSRLGGRRADAAQCVHCALDGWSARGDGSARARVAPRAATARKIRRWAFSGLGSVGSAGAPVVAAVRDLRSSWNALLLTVRRSAPTA